MGGRLVDLPRRPDRGRTIVLERVLGATRACGSDAEPDVLSGLGSAVGPFIRQGNFPSTEIGYTLAASARGKGVSTAAVAALVRRLFSWVDRAGQPRLHHHRAGSQQIDPATARTGQPGSLPARDQPAGRVRGRRHPLPQPLASLHRRPLRQRAPRPPHRSRGHRSVGASHGDDLAPTARRSTLYGVSLSSALRALSRSSSA